MVLLALAVLSLPAVSQAEEILIAVASNFAAPMAQIVADFEAASGHRVEVALGSSGRFYAQIRSGAPYQLFFSADQAKPLALEEAGLAVAGSRFTYAVGALVLWSADPARRVSADTLARGEYSRLALANPRLAPYGSAAMEVLVELQLEEATRQRRVQGENIAQTFQFVSSGNADLGFVALSQVLRDGRIESGSGWRVPSSLHSPIRQDALMLPAAADCEACQAFLSHMKAPATRALIRRFGYQTD